MAAGDDESKTKHVADESGSDVATTAVKAPQLAIVTSQKFDAPTSEPPEAEDFNLPVKPPRRRNHSLDQLESPEEIKAKVIEEVLGKVKSVPPVPKAEIESVPDVSVNGKAAEHDPEQRTSDASGPRTADGDPPQEYKAHASPSGHVPKPSLGGTSEFSHQQLAPHAEAEEEEEEEQKWQDMPALAEHRIYDDWGKVLAKSYDEVDENDNKVAYGNLGGAGKGYTRVQIDEDAQSATSMDDNTAYLFKDGMPSNALADEGEDEARDIVTQMQTTKELLTEAQRIAYVGVVRLSINTMAQEVDAFEKTKGTKKVVELTSELHKMWGQKVMIRVYKHMEIDAREQIMVEQLAEHGVLASDMTPTLMQNARIKNPTLVPTETADAGSASQSVSSPRPSSASETQESITSVSAPPTPNPDSTPPPAYEATPASELTIQDASEIDTKNIELDLRWTVLCDLFLLLIADSTYDARSRTLLERVGAALSVDWQEICRFEKRITDALEMQEQADKENWNEEEHMKTREKRARNKRMVVMGLCTVGGGLLIGLSAGALAPVIGAGLAAGFTTIGVAGTSTFLGGTGAAALIGTTGTLIGSHIGLRTSGRRTGAVKTFEYRPLLNNKRANLIVTISGWMTGKVDDVRLPFSTVDPIMGDIYSVNWEPEMLQSTGQTIQILGTEALTQTIQQILGATFLATLMAGLSLPLVLTKLSYLIDNPWTVSLARADATGLILADSLIDRNLGVRPITLVGFSLGSRVIFSCLRELARRGAYGLIQNVYIYGSPVVVKKDEWTRARTIVSGRFVNGFATNDWILAYLFRATSGGVMRVAGLATVDIPGVENTNVTETVPGHMAYRGMMPTLLHDAGWVVESLEFSEIEDPDPESHEKRQRELLNEIEAARQELEAKPEKKGFKALFSRRKAPTRKAWETYDERSQKVLHGDSAEDSEKMALENSTVMFDVDAIRKEAMTLALNGGDLEDIKGKLKVREIETTLPVLKVTMSPKVGTFAAGGSAPASPMGLGITRAATHDGSSSAAQSAVVVANDLSAKAGPSSTTTHERPSTETRRTTSIDDTTPSRPSVAWRKNPSQSHLPSPGLTYSDGSGWPSSRASTPGLEASSRGSWNGPIERPPSEAGRPSWNGSVERPALHTAQSTPNPGHASPPPVGANGGHNPWAEEEDFGKEKPVEMSFE